MILSRISSLFRSKTCTAFPTTRSTSMSSSWVKAASCSKWLRRSWRNVALDSFSWTAKDLMCSGDTLFSRVTIRKWSLLLGFKYTSTVFQCWSTHLTFGVLHGFRNEPSTGLVSPMKHISGTFLAVGLLHQNTPDKHIIHCKSCLFKNLPVTGFNGRYFDTPFARCCPQQGSAGYSVQWRSTPSPPGWREAGNKWIRHLMHMSLNNKC